jgi:hypothetical protein
MGRLLTLTKTWLGLQGKKLLRGVFLPTHLLRRLLLLQALPPKPLLRLLNLLPLRLHLQKTLSIMIMS